MKCNILYSFWPNNILRTTRWWNLQPEQNALPQTTCSRIYCLDKYRMCGILLRCRSNRRRRGWKMLGSMGQWCPYWLLMRSSDDRYTPFILMMKAGQGPSTTSLWFQILKLSMGYINFSAIALFNPWMYADKPKRRFLTPGKQLLNMDVTIVFSAQKVLPVR